MTAPRALVAFHRDFTAALWFCLLVLLVSPTHAEWVTFGIKAPLPYIDESVTDSITGGHGAYFYAEDGEATFMGITVDTNDPSFPMTIYVGEEFAVLDAATVQSAAGGYVRPNFQALPSSVPTIRLLIPLDRYSNSSLALAQALTGGVLFNTSLSFGYTRIVDSSGNYEDIVKATATYDPIHPFWIVDLTEKRKAPDGAVDLRFVTWEPDYTQYPLVSVSMYLEGRELGHKFTVVSFADNGPQMYTSVTATAATASGSVYGYTWANLGNFNVPTGSSCLTFPIGEGMSFYVIREADGVNTPDVSGFDHVFVANPGGPLDYNLFGVFPDPPLRTLQPRYFRINRARPRRRRISTGSGASMLEFH